MLFTGSGDELCGLLCLTSGSGLSSAHCRSFCLSSLCLLKVRAESSSLPFSPSPVCLEHPVPFAACSFAVSCLLFSSICLFLLIFLWGGGQSAQGLCWCIPGVAGGILCDAWCSPDGMPNVSQAGLELVSDGTGASCLLSVTWHSEALYGLAVQSFDSSWCFFSARCGSSISAKFLIYGDPTVCFCTLVTILDPLHLYFMVS
jgi:hypothetical protein